MTTAKTAKGKTLRPFTNNTMSSVIHARSQITLAPHKHIGGCSAKGENFYFFSHEEVEQCQDLFLAVHGNMNIIRCFQLGSGNYNITCTDGTQVEMNKEAAMAFIAAKQHEAGEMHVIGNIHILQRKGVEEVNGHMAEEIIRALTGKEVESENSYFLAPVEFMDDVVPFMGWRVLETEGHYSQYNAETMDEYTMGTQLRLSMGTVKQYPIAYPA